ncbi:MAG: hypothetical protein ACREVZ_04860 [Burkholderiales bacterium]
MNRQLGIICKAVLAAATLTAAQSAPIDAASAATAATTIPLKESTMIIEYNASAEDIGIQFFLDSDGWREVEIFDPNGVEIFSAETEGSLTKQGGGTELFLESVEPAIDVLPFDRFFRRFPEGTYRFRARDNAGNLQKGNAVFTHDIPAGPELITPVPASGAECARRVPLPVLIAWEPVATSAFGLPLEIVGYEVIVENDDGLNFDVKFPADIEELTVPDGLLEPATDYIFEVLAVEEGGNQTITEGCFRTAR